MHVDFIQYTKIILSNGLRLSITSHNFSLNLELENLLTHNYRTFYLKCKHGCYFIVKVIKTRNH